MNAITGDNEELAREAIALLELLALNNDDTEQRIVGICQRALTPLGPVAAVCVSPRFVCLARTTLDRLLATEVKVIAAVNFPNGGSNIESAVSETRAALTSGADEIDLVYPFRALLGGDQKTGMEMIAACRALCKGRIKLTVTLETGDLCDPQLIRVACSSSIDAGADFIKTSTGKAIINATPQAARIMLAAIAEVGGQVGFKAAGGIRTFEDAQLFIRLAQARFGPRWTNAERVRLGVSSLLDDLLTRLGIQDSGSAAGSYSR
ncbi:deoxyribose-phosphate aldolase [Pseudomonas sp. CDFA 602]|uniref:deoxyribose-phosphate aldolase n=1 Tax=Pseudomonas californiensis TaxID=2829823 RepID=UPI001E5EF6AE|nr:deoxyribose-phosphate aldolase [Pseudomonas californiensis]MCD5996314.1 deoxyribose-phosphate aldolase [Pseudomonas californiensis]MCD6001913.1 deoxyribose-phosphate aldolase [Pseudomonas californiensis]